MDYGQREPIKGVSGQEQTAFTMKTIKQLLAEDALAQAEPQMCATSPADRPARATLQQPPHMRARPNLKSSTTAVLDAERTAPPMAMPRVDTAGSEEVTIVPMATVADLIAMEQAAPEAAIETPQVTKPKSLFKRLIGA